MSTKQSIAPSSQYFFAAFAASIVLCVVAAILMDYPLLAAGPLGVLLVFQTVVDFRKVYYLLLACIPISMEFYLPNGLGTDLPTEPLIVGLMLVYILYALLQFRKIDMRFFQHSLMLFLLLHMGWMFITMVNSNLLFVSVKFFLAKSWYVVTFVFLTGLLIRNEKYFKTMYWVISLPLLFSVVFVLVRQYAHGISLELIGKAMHPFYRNHVVYAATMTLFMPFHWYARKWYPTRSFAWWAVVINGLIVLFAIQLSFTRAAYVALVIAIGSFFIIHFRLMRPTLLVATIGIFGFLGYMVHNNNYLDLAPNFEKTISHHNMEDLLEATYKLEDISTMERLYRWVAGVHMSNEEKVMGFGPGNFYNFYKKYEVSSFRTYVSDNPEKSGVHNYYLMIMVDQGIPGFIIFLILTFAALIIGERVYHETIPIERKRMVMTILLSLIIIDAFLLINDMIETDKVGSFYFINLALLINFDLLNKRENKKQQEVTPTTSFS